MAEARTVTARIPDAMMARARVAGNLAGDYPDNSLLVRAGLILVAKADRADLAEALAEAARPRGWAGRAADDSR